MSDGFRYLGSRMSRVSQLASLSLLRLATVGTWTKTPESVALRNVETFGVKGSHFSSRIIREGPYADTYKVKLGTVSDHFSMVREDSTVEVVCQDKTYLLTKVKDGNHQRSPARLRDFLVGVG